MQHISTTPFGRRPVTAGLLAAQALARAGGDHPDAADKWQILRDLGLARISFGLSDRDVATLAALVSFHPEQMIPAQMTIVFPSNATLGQRAHGMAESTLRRHLAALVGAGLILRYDSPNGKRYAVRGRAPGCDRAYGFDLSPLARRAAEITALADEARHAAERLRNLRDAVVLKLRDCEKLVAYAASALPGVWDRLSDAVILTKRALRRKLDYTALEALDQQVQALLERIMAAIPDPEIDTKTVSVTAEMDGNNGNIERHKQDSIKIISESKGCEEVEVPTVTLETTLPTLPLQVVLKACPEILSYAPNGIANWHDLITTAGFVRGMIGIDMPTWQEAMSRMGTPQAAVTLACMLQGFERITNPGGYLRSLSLKASAGQFSPGPMVMALLRTETLRAA